MNCRPFFTRTLRCTLFISSAILLSLSSPLFAENAASSAVKDLSLQESLQMAREGSNTLKMENKKLQAARLNQENVELSWVPDLLIGASYKYQEKNDAHQYGELFPFVTLSQVVFNDQASYTRKLDSMNQLVNTRIQLVTELSQLYGDIITNYFSLLQAQTSSRLEEQFFQEMQKDFDKAKLQAEDGLISQLTLMQNESMLELAKIEQDAGQNKLNYTAFELASLLNLDTETEIMASDTFAPLFYTMSFAQCKEYAKKHHPMLQLNDQVMQKLPEFRRLAELTSWPSVSVSAYVGTGATEWDNDNKYSINITATKALYDFGKTERKQEILALELDAIEDSIKNSHKNFFSRLNLLYKEFINAGKTIQKLQAYNNLAEKLNKALQKNYTMGLISYEELLQVKKKEIKRKIEYESASGRYLVAEMLLKLNCGVSDIETLVQQGSQWLESIPTDMTASNENPAKEQ